MCFSWRDCVLGVIFHPQLPPALWFCVRLRTVCHHKWAELWDTELTKAFLFGEEFRRHLH